MANHIQITAIAPRIQYVGDGVQSAFTYPFAIFQDADLEVYVDGVKQIAGYVVSGAGNTSGGVVTFSLAPVGGASVTLNRNIAIARTSDFQEAGEFRAKVINDELDTMTAALQQVADAQSRALQVSVTQTGVINPEIPAPTANTTLMWNATGDGLTNGPTADAVVVAQANALQVAADRVQTGLDAGASAASSASAATSAANASAAVAAPLAKIDDMITQVGLVPDAANTAQLTTATRTLIATAKVYDIALIAGFYGDMTPKALVVQSYSELVLARAGSFTGEAGYIDTAAVGAAVIVDILKNGVSIYTTVPQFAAGVNTLTAGVLKTDGTQDFVSGDRVSFKVTQIGSTTPGAGVRFTLTGGFA